jgi:hypothetical protein
LVNILLAVFAILIAWRKRREERIEMEERVARALPGGGSTLVVLPAGGGLVQ